jgi:hypothetical protein
MDAYTVGVENSYGSKGQALVNAAAADGVFRNGFMVCLDCAGPSVAGTCCSGWLDVRRVL